MDNKIMKFQLEAKDVKVKELLKGDFLELELYGISDANPNVNGSHFTLQSMTDGIPTMYNKPVLGYFNPARGPYGDFEGHNDNGLHYDKDLEMAYYDYNSSSSEKILGIIRESDKIQLEKDESTGLTWVKFTCCLWCAYAYKAVKSLLKSRGGKSSVSVEIEVLDSTTDERGVENINKFRFLGVTILGQKVRPGIEGANLSVRNFAADNNLLETHKYLKFAYSALDEYNKSANQMDHSESLDEFSQDSDIINSSDFREEFVENSREGGNDIPMNESKDEAKVIESFESEEPAKEAPEKEEEACKCAEDEPAKEEEACKCAEDDAAEKEEPAKEEESCGSVSENSIKCEAKEGDDNQETGTEDNKEEEAAKAEEPVKEEEACGCEGEKEEESCGKCEADPEKEEEAANAEEAAKEEEAAKAEEACKCEAEPEKEEEAVVEEVCKCEEETCKCEAVTQFVSNVEVDGEYITVDALLEKYNELKSKYSELKETIRKQEVSKLVEFATDLVNAEVGIPEDTKLEFVGKITEKCNADELVNEDGIKEFARTMFALYFYDHRNDAQEAKEADKEVKEFSIPIEKAPQVEKKASKVGKLKDAMAKLNKLD